MKSSRLHSREVLDRMKTSPEVEVHDDVSQLLQTNTESTFTRTGERKMCSGLNSKEKKKDFAFPSVLSPPALWSCEVLLSHVWLLTLDAFPTHKKINMMAYTWHFFNAFFSFTNNLITTTFVTTRLQRKQTANPNTRDPSSLNFPWNDYFTSCTIIL